jgi:hypothetical protein
VIAFPRSTPPTFAPAPPSARSPHERPRAEVGEVPGRGAIRSNAIGHSNLTSSSQNHEWARSDVQANRTDGQIDSSDLQPGPVDVAAP